jgi:hypothetical protein
VGALGFRKPPSTPLRPASAKARAVASPMPERHAPWPHARARTHDERDLAGEVVRSGSWLFHPGSADLGRGPEDRVYDDIAAAGNALRDELEVDGAQFQPEAGALGRP